MSKKNIDECVRQSLEAYFKDLNGIEPHSMYDMLVRLVEKPLLEVVMREAENNQSKAAEWLGLNRNTLRKKLLDHKLAEGRANEGKPGYSKTVYSSSARPGKRSPVKKSAR